MLASKLRMFVMVQSILLHIQFWLGMSINLFAIVPVAAPLDFFSYDAGSEMLAHVVLGFVTVVLSLVILYMCFRTEVKWAKPLAVLAVIFVVVSMMAGFAFTLGSHDKSYSMTMASTFITGFSMYFIMMYQIGKRAGAEAMAAPSPRP